MLLPSQDSLFQNKVTFLLNIILIYDQPLISTQPPLSGHLLVPQRWPLNRGSTVFLNSFWEVANLSLHRVATLGISLL